MAKTRKKVDFRKIKTCPLAKRKNKFSLGDMLEPTSAGPADDEGILLLAQHMHAARRKNRSIILMLGGAVVKEGCSGLIIDLMKRGYVQHLAGNGAVSIHDYELALIGETSEDVPNGLKDGSFGMAEETGEMMNDALVEGAARKLGYGAAIASDIASRELPHRELSLLWNADELNIPVSIHIAIGGDIIHQHPSCDGAVLGLTSFRDFRGLTEAVANLRKGVVLNIGSAVLLPEVFLKALTIARNLGHSVEKFTTANFDFLDMYRARTRIVEWPSVLGCTGIDIRGPHHETIPALHRAIVELQQE